MVEIDGIKYVLSSIQDVEAISDLFGRLFESTNANAAIDLLNFYWDYCILYGEDGFLARDILDRYNASVKKKVAYSTINKKLNLLAKKD